MSTNNQHYNGKFDAKSWVVNLRQGKIIVEQSYFVPGYTAAHHETKTGAIMAGMTNFIEEADKLKGYIEELSNMLNEEMMSSALEVIKNGPINLDDLDE